MMAHLCGFCKSYIHIEWTKTTLIICALPFLLIFGTLQLLAIILSERSGAIVSETVECVKIGKDVLLEGGSAVDAAIAVMFCEGVAGPKEIGLGGGFTALLYVGGRMQALTATPTIPEKSPLGKISRSEKIPSAMTGGIPGELLGYWEMHRKYGLLSWKRLIEPSVKLCMEGIDITEPEHVPETLPHRNKRNLNLKEFLYPEALHGILKSPLLGETLLKIANNGADIFYNGELGEAFVKDIQDAGGFLTMNDLKNYNVSWNSDVISFYLRKRFKVYTTPLPSSGIIVAFAMNIIKSYKDVHKPVFWHRVVEASKHALGLGLTLGDVLNEPDANVRNYINNLYEKMLDMDFVRAVREKISDQRILNSSIEYGSNYRQLYTESSVHVSVLAPNGDAISLTSSLLRPVATPFLSKSTGIYWNNNVRGFRVLIEDTPPGRHIHPWKRILSPHAPIIAFPKFQSKPILMLGATGGPYVPTQIIAALTRYFLVAKSIKKAINAGALHPHMKKECLEYYDDISPKILDYLKIVGHKLDNVGDGLRYLETIAIVNFNDLAQPEISARHFGGQTVLDPELRRNTFFIVIIICLVLSLLSILIADYFLTKKNYEYENENVYFVP